MSEPLNKTLAGMISIVPKLPLFNITDVLYTTPTFEFGLRNASAATKSAGKTREYAGHRVASGSACTTKVADRDDWRHALRRASSLQPPSFLRPIRPGGSSRPQWQAPRHPLDLHPWTRSLREAHWPSASPNFAGSPLARPHRRTRRGKPQPPDPDSSKAGGHRWVSPPKDGNAQDRRA